MYLPVSMLAWGSELRFSRRKTILAFDLGSESSASDCCVDCYSSPTALQHVQVPAHHRSRPLA